jgi:hypothetical protein
MRVVSFCIYGPERRKYHEGLHENIQLIATHFPDWTVVVYVGADTPTAYVRSLQSYPSVLIRATGLLGHQNSLHRFFALDDTGAEIMLVRDADSRIHWKDQWAIRRFLESDRGAHIIRDHRDHSAPILAGLWGLRAGVLDRSLRSMAAEWVPIYAGSGAPDTPTGFGIDQNFLATVVYPQITQHALVAYSFNCLFEGEDAELFPFEWSEDLFCGKVEDPTPLVADRVIPRQSSRRALDFLPKK